MEMTDQSNMKKSIDIVRAIHPYAACERAYGTDPDRGFNVWTVPEVAHLANIRIDLVGRGPTEETAWKDAAKRVTESMLPVHPDFKK